MKDRVVTATDFKAKCLALLDELNSAGGTITITKRGRAVAVVIPAPMQGWKSAKGLWAGKMRLDENLENLDVGSLWDVLRERGHS